VRVLLVTSDPDLRLSLQLLLREQPNCDVVAAVSTCDAATSLLKSSKHDLLIVDCDLGAEDTTAIVVAAEQSATPGQRIVAIGTGESPTLSALAPAVDVYVSKYEPPERLISAVLASGDQCTAADPNNSGEHQRGA
jgi:DNA-binding NarL/FixJ family response regulator